MVQTSPTINTALARQRLNGSSCPEGYKSDVGLSPLGKGTHASYILVLHLLFPASAPKLTFLWIGKMSNLSHYCSKSFVFLPSLFFSFWRVCLATCSLPILNMLCSELHPFLTVCETHHLTFTDIPPQGDQYSPSVSGQSLKFLTFILLTWIIWCKIYKSKFWSVVWKNQILLLILKNFYFIKVSAPHLLENRTSLLFFLVEGHSDKKKPTQPKTDNKNHYGLCSFQNQSQMKLIRFFDLKSNKIIFWTLFQFL